MPDEARDIAETGMKITKGANEQLGFRHPEQPEWNHISFCQFAGSARSIEDGIVTGATPSRSAPARSTARRPAPAARPAWPCFTRSGSMKTGDWFIGSSIIGSEFRLPHRLRGVGRRASGDRAGHRGRAWITGTHQHMLDPADPCPAGYRLSDTWPML